MSVISYLQLISPPEILHCLHLVWNSHSLGMSLDLSHAFIHYTMCPQGRQSMTLRKTPITIGIIVTFIFHSFFNILARSRNLSFFSLSFSFILCQPRLQSPQYCKFLSLRSLKPNICADSLRRLILQCSALLIISTSSHKSRWFLFSFHIWPTIPDLLSRPSIEMNTTWESIIKKVRLKNLNMNICKKHT